jgi:osmotically-inducible protein OsmY
MSRTSISTFSSVKLLGLALSLGTLTLVAGVTGCAGDRYTQSTGERIDDRADSSRVRKALSADTRYKYDDVSIQTFKGVVQLSGFVNTKEQKSAAGDVAKGVEGIKQVANNIVIK